MGRCGTSAVMVYTALPSHSAKELRVLIHVETSALLFNPEDMEKEMDFENRLPPPESHVRDTLISKKGFAGEYVSRRIVTTTDHIYFCAVSGTRRLSDRARIAAR